MLGEAGQAEGACEETCGEVGDHCMEIQSAEDRACDQLLSPLDLHRGDVHTRSRPGGVFAQN